jgi:hypothetical protein
MKNILIAIFIIVAFSKADIIKTKSVDLNISYALSEGDKIEIQCNKFTKKDDFLGLFNVDVYSDDEVVNNLYKEFCDVDRNDNKVRYSFKEFKNKILSQDEINKNNDFIVNINKRIYKKDYKNSPLFLELSDNDVSLKLNVNSIYSYYSFELPIILGIKKINNAVLDIIYNPDIGFISRNIKFSTSIIGKNKMHLLFSEPLKLYFGSYTNTYDINSIKECIDGEIWIKKYGRKSGKACGLIKKENK